MVLLAQLLGLLVAFIGPEKHGSDYVAIFVRQIGGTIAVSKAEGSGTIVRVRLPLLVESHLKS